MLPIRQKNLVRDNLIPEVKYMLSSLMFPLFYIGLVFLCGTDRAFRAAAQRFRKIQIPLQGSLSAWLQQKRNPQDDFKSSLPVIIFVRHVCHLQSADWSVYILVVSLTFYTGGSGGTGNLFFDFFGIVFGIYLVYFIITYIGFCRNVEEWG